MSKLVDIISQPEFWVVTVLGQLLVGLLTNWISANANKKWLDYFLCANGLLIIGLAAAQIKYYGFTADRFALGTVSAMYFLIALFGSSALKTFTLLATNILMVGVLLIPTVEQDVSWYVYSSTYLYAAVLFGLPQMIWLGALRPAHDRLRNE